MLDNLVLTSTEYSANLPKLATLGAGGMGKMSDEMLWLNKFSQKNKKLKKKAKSECFMTKVDSGKISIAKQLYNFL